MSQTVDNTNNEQLIKQDSNGLIHTNSQNRALTLLKYVSQSNSQNKKLKNIKQLMNCIDKLNEQELMINIDNKFCSELKAQIGLGISPIQKELISIIERIAERGCYYSERDTDNIFYDRLIESGLKDWIRQLLQYDLKNQNNNEQQQQYSESTFNLILTYSFINKNKKIENDYCIFCYYFFINHISSLNQKIAQNQSRNELNSTDNKQIMISDEEMINGGRIIKAFEGLIEFWENREQFIKLKYTDCLFPLIHFNGSISQNCKQCISLPESDSAFKFQSNILRILNTTIMTSNIFKQQLINNFSAFDHIIPIIIQTAASKNHSDNISLAIVSNSIQLLSSLIYTSNQTFKKLVNIPKLGQSLVTLAQFERTNHIIQNQNVLSDIRLYSNSCLQLIRFYGDENIQYKLIRELNVIKLQIEILGIGGGNEEQNVLIIRNAVSFVGSIFLSYRREYQYCQELPDLLKEVYEQIEQENGIEEIQANQFHSLQMGVNHMSYYANQSLQWIVNAFVYQ